MWDVVAQHIEITPQPRADGPAGPGSKPCHHSARERITAASGNKIYVDAFAETFSILTGGRQDRRRPLPELSALPYVQIQALSGKDMVAARAECEVRGVQEGAVPSPGGTSRHNPVRLAYAAFRTCDR
jgi:hypothetical protein